MHPINLIQCTHCADAYHEFLRLNGIEPDSKKGKLIAEYALFAEIRRLKTKQVDSSTTMPSKTTGYGLGISDTTVRHTVTC